MLDSGIDEVPVQGDRLAVNVDNVYSELDAERCRTDMVTLFSMMAALAL